MQASSNVKTSSLRTTIFYLVTIFVAIAVFFLIRTRGELLVAPAPPAGGAVTPVAGATPDMLWNLLLAMVAVVIVGRMLGRVFSFVGQPPVIGEVVGGILLGPSLLGYVSPAAYVFILPPAVATFLSGVAQLGVVLYMFLVGLDLNSERLRSRVHATVATSHASIVAPFVLGAALALYLYPRLSTSNVSFTSFAL